MVRVQQRFGVSERRACEVLGQARSTQRRSRKRGADEAVLRVPDGYRDVEGGGLGW